MRKLTEQQHSSLVTISFGMKVPESEANVLISRGLVERDGRKYVLTYQGEAALENHWEGCTNEEIARRLKL